MDQELVQYLDERFHGLIHGLDRRFEQIDRRFEGIDRRFDEVNERIAEAKRHSGVLVEGLRHEVHLLAEGFATFIEVRYAQDQAKIDRRFDETNVLIRSSYDHLRQRVENLKRNRPN